MTTPAGSRPNQNFRTLLRPAPNRSASQSTRASFANSDGWKVIPMPSDSQRLRPLSSMPMCGTSVMPTSTVEISSSHVTGRMPSHEGWLNQR